MRCLFVAPTMMFGGAERVTSILANSWQKNGMEVRILLTATETISEYPIEKGVQLLSCSKEARQHKIPHLTIVKSIRSVCKTWKPDVVISFFNAECALCALALRGLHIPLIYSERNDPNKTNQRKMEKFYRKIVEHSANYVVFQTKGAQNCYPDFVQKKSTIILNPLDVEKLPSRLEGERRNAVVSVGRLTAQKNQKLLIDAFSEIAASFPDVQLEIYGDGNLKEELQKQIIEKKCQKQISLMGNSQQVLEDIRDAALFVMTSDYEGIPNALVEAMCMGIPCISTNCSPGGAAELINTEAGNGVLVECGDKEALKREMHRLLMDTKAADAIGHKAMMLRDRVDVKKVELAWKSVIETVVGK